MLDEKKGGGVGKGWKHKNGKRVRGDGGTSAPRKKGDIHTQPLARGERGGGTKKELEKNVDFGRKSRRKPSLANRLANRRRGTKSRGKVQGASREIRSSGASRAIPRRSEIAQEIEKAKEKCDT